MWVAGAVGVGQNTPTIKIVVVTSPGLGFKNNFEILVCNSLCCFVQKAKGC